MTQFLHPETYSKNLAATTQKVYSGKLNTLARAGFDTVQSLLTDPNKVIEAIEAASPGDTEANKTARRYFLSAIFWVLPADYKTKENPFHRYWEKNMPSTDVSTGLKWVLKSKL
jgi:hypothetical protein